MTIKLFLEILSLIVSAGVLSTWLAILAGVVIKTGIEYFFKEREAYEKRIMDLLPRDHADAIRYPN